MASVWQAEGVFSILSVHAQFNFAGNLAKLCTEIFCEQVIKCMDNFPHKHFLRYLQAIWILYMFFLTDEAPEVFVSVGFGILFRYPWD